MSYDNHGHTTKAKVKSLHGSLIGNKQKEHILRGCCKDHTRSLGMETNSRNQGEGDRRKSPFTEEIRVAKFFKQEY